MLAAPSLKSHFRFAAFDRSFYVIVCRGISGEPFANERMLAGMTETAVVADIASGQLEEVLSVFEFNPAEGWSRDVSEDIARAIFLQGPIPAVCIDFVQDYVPEALRESAA